MDKNCLSCVFFKVADDLSNDGGTCKNLGETETDTSNKHRIAHTLVCCCGDFCVPQPEKFYCALHREKKD